MDGGLRILQWVTDCSMEQLMDHFIDLEILKIQWVCKIIANNKNTDTKEWLPNISMKNMLRIDKKHHRS
jgi:hypothetical protein